ncbi:MAG: aminotransferase class I/II-fold pyridoxal phosphate-dependent enzyme, partial [Spirochaetes bacterium]|nr:aminotransferase class I/II-fold pyridoxal phosphate-dependent enzyme [Spirochaetota bacterium]
EEEGWQPDIDDIRKKISNRTKIIVVINPNNPTGALYSKKVLKEIIDIAGEYDIPIASDEIYDDLTFNEKQISTASLAKDVPVITFNGFSKVYLVPGWRVGYILFHHNNELDDIQDAFMRIARSRLCANSVCQQACIAALKGPQNHIREVNDKLRKRRDFAFKRLNEIPGISTAKPDGAFYIFPECPYEEDEFIKNALNHSLLIIPGSIFSEKNTNFRISFSASMSTLEKGAEILKKIKNG